MEASDLGVQGYGDKQEAQDNNNTLSRAGSWGSTNVAESTPDKQIVACRSSVVQGVK